MPLIQFSRPLKKGPPARQTVNVTFRMRIGSVFYCVLFSFSAFDFKRGTLLLLYWGGWQQCCDFDRPRCHLAIFFLHQQLTLTNSHYIMYQDQKKLSNERQPVAFSSYCRCFMVVEAECGQPTRFLICFLNVQVGSPKRALAEKAH